MIIKLERSNNFEHYQSKKSFRFHPSHISLCRNLKEDVQRLQREKDELSMKNENIHDEMTPRYDFFTSFSYLHIG